MIGLHSERAMPRLCELPSQSGSGEYVVCFTHLDDRPARQFASDRYMYGDCEVFRVLRGKADCRSCLRDNDPPVPVPEVSLINMLHVITLLVKYGVTEILCQLFSVAAPNHLSAPESTGMEVTPWHFMRQVQYRIFGNLRRVW